MPLRVLQRSSPRRVVALATDTHVLSFSHSPATAPSHPSNSTNGQVQNAPVSCLVEFQPIQAIDLREYRSLTSLAIQGTLGLVTVGTDVFLCLVNGASKVASVRQGEDVRKITSVEFYCINRSDHDALMDPDGQVGGFDDDDDEILGTRPVYQQQQAVEHPCAPLKKLLSGNSFYYSADFDLTRRLQDRINLSTTIALDSLDGGYLWNAFMIQPLVDFRFRLSQADREALDDSRILTSAIRGFAMTIPVPPSASPFDTGRSGMPSSITLISRLSCRRAGTRFKSRGVDDDGNVANFVETETIFCTPSGLCFSYVQIRGSVPVFWEQAAGFTPAQQKISLTRSPEATQPAFDKHFDEMQAIYGGVHIVNLLSNEKPGELELTNRYRYHVAHNPLSARSMVDAHKHSDHRLLQETDYDFHAETRGQGYEAASGIKRHLLDAAESFVFFLSEQVQDEPRDGAGNKRDEIWRPMPILQQQGVFRTNCLDCLDRTNLVQTLISQMAVEELLKQRGAASTADFLLRHSTLWADNGDALSKIYAGTGALKSSFTRSGKMSIAGALADVRKSATRLYINNFEDKGRQQTIDMLLGRLMGQTPVHLFDPVHDTVTAELARRSAEYTSSMEIGVLVGTFNLNGRDHGIDVDLSPWLCPGGRDAKQQQPEIVAVGFQEIVELSPQQIMSTDANRRLAWEAALKRTLNANAQRGGSEEYILLRGGQLVGASLSVYVKASVLPYIKNVEGALIKTGLSGMAGNKGAVAIRMDYAQTSLCLVTAHLAAGFANYEERNSDFRTISTGLHFARNRQIADHDAIIWFGDFNYRIGMSNERVRQLLSLQGNKAASAGSGSDGGGYASQVHSLETLYANDQLNLQMVHGKTFPHYSEGRIRFAPTYKFDVGTNEYDSSPAQRIPAWTDRVLAKGRCLRQTSYDTADLRFSDHRPVYATYRCTVAVVDEKIKKDIADGLYARRRGGQVGATTVTTDLLSETADNQEDVSEDSSSMIEHDYVDAGLPAASSDKQKWWLEGGLAARSQLVDELGSRPSTGTGTGNPFALSTPDEWVRVDRPPALPTRPSVGPRSESKQTLRKPLVPTKPAVLRQDPARRPSDTPSRQPSRGPVLKRPESSSRTSSRKSSATSSTVTFQTAESKAPPAPPPRRSTIQKAPPAHLQATGGRKKGSLLDEKGQGDLTSWEALLPG